MNATFNVNKDNGAVSIEMIIDNEIVGNFEYANEKTKIFANPRFQGKDVGLGKDMGIVRILILYMLSIITNYTVDNEVSDLFKDRLKSLEDSGYIVKNDKYWNLTDKGQDFVKQNLS